MDYNFELTAAGSLAADFTSEPFLANNMSRFSAQFVSTSTAVGSIKLQGSNDAGAFTSVAASGKVTGASGITNWDDVDGATLAIPSARSYSLGVINPEFRWYQLVYTRTSGTGAATIRVNGVGPR